jgi:hypothetical protein
MPQPTVMRTLDSGWEKTGSTMVNDLAMRLLAQQRSEQLIGEAERSARAAALRPARSALIRRRVAAVFARAMSSDGEERPGRFGVRVGSS